MDIIRADADRHEIGFIQDFTKFDAEISQTPTLDRNQFVLTMDEDDYLESGITDGAFVYIPFSEFGGQVDEIKHASKQGQVTISGATWRGLLCRKIVEPPKGAAYLTIGKTEPNKALKTLIGDRFGDFFDVFLASSVFKRCWMRSYRPSLTLALKFRASTITFRRKCACFPGRFRIIPRSSICRRITAYT